MNIQQYPSPTWWFSTLLALVLLGSSPAVFAQETEPNNTCLTANAFGGVALPFSINGELSAFESTADVDFYRFEAEPGATIEVTLAGTSSGQGTLGDPFLGFFDDGCNLVSYNDDFLGWDSRLVITVPDSGGFVLAATGCCDADFTGGHVQEGTYLLTLSSLPPDIGSISGRVVDAETGVGLSGVDYPYTWVELQKCQQGEDGFTWCYYISGASPDGAGNFSFVPGYPGQMPAGDYKILAYAQDYVTGEGTAIPAVVAEEHRDAGDIPLEPHPIRLSVVTPCEDLPATGGTCRYSVLVTNRSANLLKGAAWSLVNGPTGSLKGWTQFQTARPIYAVLRPGASRAVDFQFYVPSTVPNWSWICVSTFFGEDPKQPFFNTLAETPFCIVKGVDGFSSVPEKEVQKIFREQKRLHDGFHNPKQK